MNKNDLKNGMIVVLRRGVTRVIIGKYLVDDDVNICNILENYNDDLTHINNCKNEDIIKVEYGGEIIWERGVEWENIPFGTEVKVWDDDRDKLVGRFLAYDDDDTELPFLVFIENDNEANWYSHCEIIEEDE